MLPADELIYDGKVVPLQIAKIRPLSDAATSSNKMGSTDAPKSRRRWWSSKSDQYIFSPKAIRGSSRWKELLGLKILQNPNPESSLPSKKHSLKTLNHFLHRNPRSYSIESSLSLPLLRDSDSDSVSISSRLSVSSSSSSGPDCEDLPCLSLDSERPNLNPLFLSLNRNPPRVRVPKPRGMLDPTVRIERGQMCRTLDPNVMPSRGVSVDSPRMNSSGKIVFHSLERSSSSPSIFNGRSRIGTPRCIERSYSANVRITPLLNVPICSLRGSSKAGSVFGLRQLFSPQKRGSRSEKSHNRAKTDRI